MVANGLSLCRAHGPGRKIARQCSVHVSVGLCPCAERMLCSLWPKCQGSMAACWAVLNRYAQHLLCSLGAKVGPGIEMLEERLCGPCMCPVYGMCFGDHSQTAGLQRKLRLVTLTGEQPAI